MPTYAIHGNKDDYYENLKLRDELDKYIQSTDLKAKQKDDNQNYK